VDSSSRPAEVACTEDAPGANKRAEVQPSGAGAPLAGAPTPAPRALGTRGEARPVFWRELYWFALIALGAWILGLLVLAPRLSRNRQAYEYEESLRREGEELTRREAQYEAAVEAMENDPYYRDEAYRHFLRVKKSGEVFLKDDLQTSDKEGGEVR
jgi:cell division protein FtsB